MKKNCWECGGTGVVKSAFDIVLNVLYGMVRSNRSHGSRCTRCGGTGRARH